MTDFKDKVEKYCTGKGLFVGVSCIVAGLSGGPDSVALVALLAELRSGREDFPHIYAVHVNHGLRDEASYDEELSRKLCETLDIPFKAYHYDVKAEAAKLGRGLEETGRILRYRAFDDMADSACRELNIPRTGARIATAHHLGDLSETFMMNLFRGSGLEGLTAMGSTEYVIRPLIEVTKDEILQYLSDKGLEYATDETNLHTDFTRNKWRNEIFPVIAEASVKDPKEAIFDTYTLLSSDEDFLSSEAVKAYEDLKIREGGYIFIRSEELNELHPAISSRVIRLYWLESFGNLTDFEMKHTAIVMELTSLKGGTHYADLPFGRGALTVEGLLGFYGEEGPAGISCAISCFLGFPAVPGDFGVTISLDELSEGSKTLKLPDSGVSIEASVVENNESIVYNTLSWICPEKVIDIGTIPAEGDFLKAGSAHKASLGKLMSDMKVPRDARSHLIAASSGGKLLWIPGLGHADGFISSKSRSRWLEENTGRNGGKLIRLEIIRKEDKGG